MWNAYRPDAGINVVYWRNDQGVTYSRFKEFHGPWPAPPRERYDYPKPASSMEQAQAILKRYGIELEIEPGAYAEGATTVTLRFNGETLLNQYEWDASDYDGTWHG